MKINRFDHLGWFRIGGRRLPRILALLAFPALVSAMQLIAQEISRQSIPKILGDHGSIPQKFEQFEVILGPDKDAADWWAGAPSVVRDNRGTFWLACRMRTAKGQRGRRGYEIHILRSEDGRVFRKVHAIRREEVPIPGFERPSLLLDPADLLSQIMLCGENYG